MNSIIYFIGVLPTAFFFVGLTALIENFPPFVRIFELRQDEHRRLLVCYVALFFLLGNLGS